MPLAGVADRSGGNARRKEKWLCPRLRAAATQECVAPMGGVARDSAK